MEACPRSSDANLDATELRLELPGTEPYDKPSPIVARAANKRALEEDTKCHPNKNEPKWVQQSFRLQYLDNILVI